MAVDDATNTVYVANNRDGDTPGTVSVIDGATCNGSDTRGCAGTIPTVVIGRSPRLAVVDPRTNVVYTTDKSKRGGVSTQRSDMQRSSHDWLEHRRAFLPGRLTADRTGGKPQDEYRLRDDIPRLRVNVDFREPTIGSSWARIVEALAEPPHPDLAARDPP